MGADEPAIVAMGRVDVAGGLIEVAAELDGVFDQVFVVAGDRVEAGELLAVQSPGDEVNRVENATLQVEAAKLQLKDAELSLSISERELERVDLQYARDAVSRMELERAQDSVARANLSVQRGQAKLQTARSDLRSAQYGTGRREILAPVSGQIVESYAKPGAGSSVQQVSVAFLLLPDAPSEITVEVVESDLDRIEVGVPVTIFARSDPHTQYIGEVQRVASTFKGGDGMSQRGVDVVEVTISAPTLPFRIGRPVLVRFDRPKAVDQAQRAGVEDAVR